MTLTVAHPEGPVPGSRSGVRRSGTAALFLGVVLAPVAAQLQWRLADPGRHDIAAMAHDTARARTVLFGGFSFSSFQYLDDTLEWNGSTWALLQPTSRPGARAGHRMVFDAGRRRVLLFGGGLVNGALLNDTWEWDGSTWARRFPATSPPARDGFGMAYDAARGRVVVFGGSTQLGDTWEWDGSNWSLRAQSGPAPRSSPGLCFDSHRNRVVLFGGQTGNNLFAGDTWEWDGTTWTQRAPAASPPALVPRGFAFDGARGRAVLSGGNTSLDTWEWDGTTWVQLLPTVHPTDCRSLAFDSARQRVLLFNGRELWTWDGSQWTWEYGIPNVQWGGLVYDLLRGRTLLCDGSSVFLSMWEYDGVRWQRATASGSAPQTRRNYAVAVDLARGRLVLFGGTMGGISSLMGDTWEWDGTRWTQYFPSVAPSPRDLHAMAYDVARGRVVLFGGEDLAQGSRNDTWEWDGTTWLLRTPTRSPSPRANHALAYDLARGRVVLYGHLSETWEWDGSNWTNRTTTGPQTRSGFTLAYDVARQRTVLWGGADAVGFVMDPWEWDGTTWRRRTITGPMPAAPPGAIAYDIARRCLVVFGGGPTLDTWECSPVQPAAFTAYGSGCPGSGGVPLLDLADGALPWLGDGITLGVTHLPAGGVGALLVGASRSSWAGLALPWDLASVGAPGCGLLAGGTSVWPLRAVNGVATTPLVLPNDPALAGGTFYAQALVLDTPANAAGLTASNGVAARLGSR